MAEKCSILFQFRVYLGRVEQKERKKMLFRNIKGGNILGNSYKICFLGYRKLREMAQQVIDKLNYQDTTVVMKECAIETLEQVVNEADSEGCQVFVAGSANAEEFKQRFSEHLVELHIDMSDYVYCLCRARDMGARRVGVTIYRKSRQMNFEALQELAGIPIEPIYYESEPELTYLLEHTSRKIHEIGADVGIQDTRHFIRMFRKTCGMLPTEYRSTHSKTHTPAPPL